MAYCPKCGVKVSQGGRKCPLCDFPIPEVEENSIEHAHPFPTPENVYPKEFVAIKRRIFKNMAIFFLVAVVAMYLLNVLLHGTLTWARYSIASTLYLLAYIGVFLNFVPNPYFIVSASFMITTALLLSLDRIDGHMGWFVSLGIPLVVGAFLLSLVGVFTYRRLKLKPLVLAGVVMLLMAAYVMVVEASVDSHLHGQIRLFWSYIAGVPLAALGLSALYFHHYFPQTMKDEIKRKLHT